MRCFVGLQSADTDDGEYDNKLPHDSSTRYGGYREGAIIDARFS